MDQNHERFMRRAIALAQRGKRLDGCSPIGALLVLDGAIIGEAYNKVDRRCDPTAHAEILAIRAAGRKQGASRFGGAILYSTLQPCGMCSMASIWAGIGGIVYGARRDQVHKMYFEDRHLGIGDYLHDAYRGEMKILGGILGDDCAGFYYQPDDDPPIGKQANRKPGDHR
jgi:tRNA(adenine34) deaminase